MTNPPSPYGDDSWPAQGPEQTAGGQVWRPTPEQPYGPPPGWNPQQQSQPYQQHRQTDALNYHQPQGQPYPGQSINFYASDNSNNTSLAPVTSLVSGLIGFFIAWIPIVGIAAWVFGPLALVFGILGLKRGKAEHKIMSVIGIIAGAIALAWCIGYLVFFVAAAMSGNGQ